MATKDFKSMMKSNPRAVRSTEPTEAAPVPATTTAPVETEEAVTKKPVGRPPLDPDGKKKKDYTKTVNIAIPLDTLDKIQIAKVKYGDNLTKYINALIEKDLEANFESYQAIYDMLNN